MKADAVVDAYLTEAASWDADRVAMLTRSGRIAWRIASAALLLLALSLLTLMLLMPLKHVEPFVIRVDNSTGVVDVVPVFAGRAPMTEVVTRYLLDHYVTVCERFNFSTAESDYEECAAFHNAARNQAWFSQWDRANPASPLNVYKDGSSIRAQVSAVSFFKRGSGLEGLAQIRYTKALRSGGGGQDQVSHWIATAEFSYGEPSKDPRLRRWDPLGFRIEDFHAEPEVLPADGAGAPSLKGPNPAASGGLGTHP